MDGCVNAKTFTENRAGWPDELRVFWRALEVKVEKQARTNSDLALNLQVHRGPLSIRHFKAEEFQCQRHFKVDYSSSTIHKTTIQPSCRTLQTM